MEAEEEEGSAGESSAVGLKEGAGQWSIALKNTSSS